LLDGVQLARKRKLSNVSFWKECMLLIVFYNCSALWMVRSRWVRKNGLTIL
jgi:hypothetical protein